MNPEIRRRKITVVGAGNVGASAAAWLAEKGVFDVVLVDVIDGLPQGKALDLQQAGPVIGFDSVVTGSNDYGPTAGSDLFIVTAGIARKPGMSRDDLLKTNTGIVKSVAEQIKKTSPNAFVIVVSNPLDVMCYVMRQVTGYPRERVLGMAGVLDSARMATFIAKELNVSVKNVNAFVLGGHGDTMVPMPRYTTVAGIPLPELLSKDKIDAIVKRTANGGAEVVALLKTGSAFYAPSASAVQMAEAILFDKKHILPCAVWLQGEYGLKDVYVGVPAKLGAKGLEQVIPLKLTAEEQAALNKSAESVRELQGLTGV
jgi:malate dehydrogenase